MICITIHIFFLKLSYDTYMMHDTICNTFWRWVYRYCIPWVTLLASLFNRSFLYLSKKKKEKKLLRKLVPLAWWSIICLWTKICYYHWENFAFSVQMSSFPSFGCFKLILNWKKYLSSPSALGLESFGWLTLTSWLVHYNLCIDMLEPLPDAPNWMWSSLSMWSDYWLYWPCLLFRVSYICMF